LIRQFLFAEERLAFREVAYHLFEQNLYLIALQGRERHARAPVILLRVPLHQREKL
jgi:hypothetical protein